MDNTGEQPKPPAPLMYQGWQPPGQPMAPWAPPPQPPPRKGLSGGLIAVFVVVGVIVLGCVGTAGWGAVRFVHNMNAAAERDRAAGTRPNFGVPNADPSASPAPEEDEETETGPRASSYPVREAKDLTRVCDHWYYPQSPKYAGKSPHPISVGTVDSKEFTSRIMSSYVDVPYELGAKVQKAWAPSNAAKSQLMACVDLTATGTKVVKKCKFDDPKPAKLPMKIATFRVSLYEVATGRKLADKTVKGEDDTCPTFVMLGSDRTVYSKVGDRQLYELLRDYVMKK
jgi:hypothetical protein